MQKRDLSCILLVRILDSMRNLKKINAILNPVSGPTDPPTEEGFCDDKVDGLYAHFECNKYFQCYNSGAGQQVLTCAPGTLFSPSAGFCDFPQNVDCTETTIGPGTI